jgi:uncharacterized protein (DUF433 family)
MTANILSIDEIVSDPQVRGGRPSIRGTGVTVMNVVLAHTGPDKFPLERVAHGFDLTLGQVHAAMAYYYNHQAELDAVQSQEDADTTALMADLVRQGKATILSVTAS